MTTPLGGPTRILIADDQEDVRSGFRLILGSQPDMTVVGEAADGLTAVELARTLRPDLVLADIRMPGVDGLEVTRRLAGPGVPDPMRVLVVNTFDHDDYVRTALREGACGFLLKRSGPGLLIEGVRAAMAGDLLISPQITVRLLQNLAPRPRPGSVHSPVTSHGPGAGDRPAGRRGTHQRRDRREALHHGGHRQDPHRQRPGEVEGPQPGGHSRLVLGERAGRPGPTGVDRTQVTPAAGPRSARRGPSRELPAPRPPSPLPYARLYAPSAT